MEKRYYCFLCDEELSDKNSSNEHILLNALGGRLHSRSLLCKRCNSMIGNRFDDELARELNFAASYLNVPRQRGLNQIIRTEENEKYDLLPGGKPVLKRPQITTEITEGKGKVEIVSRSKAEAKEIIRGLSKKYPGINAEEALQQMMVKKEYLGRKVRFTTAFHAREIYPSIIKSAVEYYLYSGGATSTIAHLKPMILGRGNVEECCKYYYPVQDYFAMKDEEINHVLYVKGSHDEKVLYGFVSYFGVIQCLVLLNDHYDGPDMENSYVYNVMTTDSRPEKTQYDLSRDAVLNVIQTSSINEIIDTECDEDGWAGLAAVGNKLNRKITDFDVRNFGFSRLKPFIEHLGVYDIKIEALSSKSDSKVVYIKKKLSS